MAYLSRARHLIRTRDLRKNLKATVDGDEPRILGTEYHARAMIIPLHGVRPYFGDAMKPILAQARKDFENLVECLKGL